MNLALRWSAVELEGGNAYGFGLHSRRQREGLEALGVEIRDDAPIALTVQSPGFFDPVPGAFNVLSTHCEAERLTPEQAQRAARADLIIAASTWSAGVFRAACPGVPVEVVPLGVDRDLVPQRRRKPPEGRPFRWLWVGAANARKGWELVASAWQERVLDLPAWADAEDAELYVKTSRDTIVRHPSGDGWVRVDRPGEVVRFGNVTIDSRRLPRADLVDLYRSAHGFLFPSYGEGFGLTLAEAMASGVPAIWTHWGGVTDYASLVPGIRVPFEMVRAGDVMRGVALEAGFDADARIPQPPPGALAACMWNVLGHYTKHAKAAHKAGRVIFRRYSWEASARALRDVLARHAAARPGIVKSLTSRFGEAA